MNEVATLFELIAAAVVIAAPPTLFIRWLAGGEGAGPTNLFRLPADLPWPRGVQEADPPRWRPDMLHRPDVASGRTSPATGDPTRIGQRTVTADVETARCG